MNRIYIIYIKTRFGVEEIVATCQFVDDAELIFESYKKSNITCKIECEGLVGIEVTHNYESSI